MAIQNPQDKKSQRKKKQKGRDHSEWIVHGQTKTNPWVMVAIVVGIAALVVLAYQRLMNFDTITYELRQCEQPLTEESSWAEVTAAGCEPISIDGVTLKVYEGRSEHVPDSTEDSTFIFDSYPVNSIEHVLEIDGTPPGDALLLGDPQGEEIRRAMSSDAGGRDWSTYVGARGPTEYWLLLTPRS